MRHLCKGYAKEMLARYGSYWGFNWFPFLNIILTNILPYLVLVLPLVLPLAAHSQRSRAQIVNLPQTVTFNEYVPNEINCEVEGNPAPVVIWTRIDGQADGNTRTDGSRLIFESPRKSDEGRYRCQARNDLNVDEKYVQVYVVGNAPQPQPPARERLYIQPENYNGESGDIIRFVCQSTSGAQLHYEWLHDGYPLNVPQSSHVIISGDTLEIRDATTRDNGVYTCVGIDLRTHRNYTEDARVYIEERQQPPIGNGWVKAQRKLQI